MSSNDRQEPELSSEQSILDDINTSTNQAEEVVAAVPEQKFSVFSLLTNKRNKKLFLIFTSLGLMALILVLFSYSKLTGESSPTRSKKTNLNASSPGVERVLPAGPQTQAQMDEINRYNEQNLDGRTQPIAVENSAEMSEPLDVSIFDEGEFDQESGCKLDDTACMVVKKRIPPGGCAPKDANCLVNKTGKQKNIEVKEHVVEPTQREIQLKRLENKEYASEMLKRIKSAAEKQQKLVEESGEVVDLSSLSEKSSDDSIASAGEKTTIAGGLIVEGSGAAPVELIAHSGDRLMGSADIALNSKIEGEVSLSVYGGSFVESRMLGNVKRVDDYMRLELYNWVLPDGRECDISAVALDKKTTYAAVASRVDHHTLYRYGWWGLGAVLSAVGKASQDNVDRDVIINNNGSAIESTKKDSERELKMALGSLGEDIGKVMQKRIDTPSTVYIDVNETMGVFFIKPVTTANCKLGGMQKHVADKDKYYFQ